MDLNLEQTEAMEEARRQTHPTRRPTVPAMEDRLFTPIPCLDQGFVRLVDYMGDDTAIVQAARVSYGKGTQHIRKDRGLLRYLMRHRHSTPFEMCEIKLHVKLPIFVARQWIRHRTANVNEISARYSVLDKEFYMPSMEDMHTQSVSNRQGRGTVLSGEKAAAALAMLKEDALRCYSTYETLLSEEYGLARELARMNLPVNLYTQWYWKVDLHNLLHFLSLRADPHAQYEIRVFAHAISEIVADWVPYTHAAFQDYRMGGAFLSRMEIEVIQAALRGEKLSREGTGISPREWRALCSRFGLTNTD